MFFFFLCFFQFLIFLFFLFFFFFNKSKNIGAEIQGVTVTAGSATSVTVETSQGWTCTGGVMMGVLATSSGFESAPTQVGSALTEGTFKN